MKLQVIKNLGLNPTKKWINSWAHHVENKEFESEADEKMKHLPPLWKKPGDALGYLKGTSEFSSIKNSSAQVVLIKIHLAQSYNLSLYWFFQGWSVGLPT